MKQFFLFGFIATAVLAALGYFLAPTLFSTSSASLPLSIGTLLGAGSIMLMTPGLLKTSTPSSVSAQHSSDEPFTTLYVGNLAYRVNERLVQEHFAQFGRVNSVRLMKDRKTGKRKGFGFVEIDTQVAEQVIHKLNDTDFHERTLKVRLAKEKVD